MNDHVVIDFIVNPFPGWFIVQCIVAVRQGSATFDKVRFLSS